MAQASSSMEESSSGHSESLVTVTPSADRQDLVLSVVPPPQVTGHAVHEDHSDHSEAEECPNHKSHYRRQNIDMNTWHWTSIESTILNFSSGTIFGTVAGCNIIAIWIFACP